MNFGDDLVVRTREVAGKGGLAVLGAAGRLSRQLIGKKFESTLLWCLLSFVQGSVSGNGR